jgi:hypothetical protein
MEPKNNNKTKIVGIRLTPNEYDKLQRNWKETTCRKLSDYARRKLFDKTFITTHRNQSLDDFMAEMIRLRAELNSVGNNFNQAVKRLHTIHQIAEFREWLLGWELDKKILFNKIETIKDKIGKIAEEWLQ